MKCSMILRNGPRTINMATLPLTAAAEDLGAEGFMIPSRFSGKFLAVEAFSTISSGAADRIPLSLNAAMISVTIWKLLSRRQLTVAKRKLPSRSPKNATFAVEKAQSRAPMLNSAQPVADAARCSLHAAFSALPKPVHTVRVPDASLKTLARPAAELAAASALQK